MTMRDDGTSSARSTPDTRWSDEDLLEGMRRNDAAAIHEFFERFSPLIAKLARLWRFPSESVRERVDEFLDDAALRLIDRATVIQTSLSHYLAVSFHRRHRNRIRDLRCREELRQAYSVEAAAGFERGDLEATSEDNIRNSNGPAWDAHEATSVVQRLGDLVEDGLTEDEWVLLSWLAARVPQRQIADWLGVSHGATRVRINRLRAGLRDAALRHASRFEGPDRREIDRFLRRLGAEQSAGTPELERSDTRGQRDKRIVEEDDR